VSQLTVLGRSNLLVSLSDGVVAVHDIGIQAQANGVRLPVISIRTQLSKAKQATMYAIDTSTPEYRLCIATAKKKLCFYRLAPGAKEFEEVLERTTPDVAKSLAWAGPRLCVGYRKEYVMMDVKTGALQDMFETGKSGTPIGTVMPNQQLLLNKENISIFIGFDGKPLRKHGIVWSEPPIDFGYAFPYVVGLLPSCVELRTLTTVNPIQMIRSCKGATRLALSDDQIYCASQSVVWRLEPVPIWDQVAQLVGDNEFAEALDLLDCLPDSNEKSDKKRTLSLQYAFHLFHLGQHEQALKKFLELKEDPLRVLGLFPLMLPHGIMQRYKYPYGVGLNEAKLENAHRALAAYLQRLRAENKDLFAAPPQDVPTDYQLCGELVSVVLDTSLLRALLKIDHPFLGELVSHENQCHIPVSEAMLTAAKKHKELVALYRTRGYHTKALELLQSLVKQPDTPGELSALQQMAAYLTTLTNRDLNLILDYSVWVLQQDAELGLSIFTAPRKRPEDKLEATTVLKHLNKHAQTEVADFLEHIIGQGETDAAFHNELIFTYLKSILLILEYPTKGSASSQATSSSASSGKLVRAPRKAADEIGLLGVCRRKLLVFLESSRHYKAEIMLSRFPTNDLFEERAILLSRIGRHDQALAIYAHKLEDAEMAEKYCAKHYNAADKDTSQIYLVLLGVYLNPPPELGRKPMEANALHLLNRFYDRMDTIKALAILPGGIAVKKIEPFLNSVLQANERVQREHNLQRALLRAETLTVKNEWCQARGKRIRIADRQICPSCGKRIGKDVTFVLLPDETVMHYVCYQK
jgi:tetratricopeptide (TPR) repeat protein